MMRMIYIDEETNNKLKRLAKSLGLSASALIRLLINEEYRRRGE